LQCLTNDTQRLQNFG